MQLHPLDIMPIFFQAAAMERRRRKKRMKKTRMRAAKSPPRNLPALPLTRTKRPLA